MGRVLNLKGSVFGRLTAVECVGKDKSNRALWRCVCECGYVGRRYQEGTLLMEVC